MWNQNSIHSIETIAESFDQKNSSNKAFNPQFRQTFAEDIEDMDDKRIRKINAVSFGSGILFLSAFLLLAMNGKIRLSGPYMPTYLAQFSQKLEYVLRYQSLCLSPIAVNVLLVYIRRFKRSQTDDTSDEVMDRLVQPLYDSIQQFLMSTIIQMVMAANLEAQHVLVFCPFLAITFFIGCVAYLVSYPIYHYFGLALCFMPTLIAVVFNAYGAIRFIFH